MAVGSSKTRWTLIALAAIGVLFFALVVTVLPPAPERVDTNGWAEIAVRTVAGAYHIHTTRSDGHGDKRDVAAAAARAGLKFVILTDHGDGTRPPDPPEYIDGVLCLDGVEISTDAGHLVAIDMPRAPYPLGGSAEAVVEDVHRLGGLAIAAHPDSPKPALRWTDSRAPIDGIEWLNLDSEWRKDSRGRLIRAGLAYFFRPGPALASLMDRPQILIRWGRFNPRRDPPLVGLAGADAHGGVGVRTEDSGRSFAGMIGIPSYEASFRTFSNRVMLDAPLSGDPARDARAIYGAIRKGSVFTTIDALAGPGLLDFQVQGTRVIAQATRPAGSELDLYHDGLPVGYSTVRLSYDASKKPGAYRVEVHLARAPGDLPMPWLVSNFVETQIGGAAVTASSPIASSAPAPSAPPVAASTVAPFPWRIEKDPASSAILRTTDHSAELRYTLATGAKNSQFVALATDVHSQTFTAMRYVLRADQPTRISVQVRTGLGARWGRSYYVDPGGTEIAVRLDDLQLIGDGPAVVPDSRSLSSILLVVDLTNAVPGHSGQLTILSSELVK